jgi:Rieske Fe-S protein
VGAVVGFIVARNSSAAGQPAGTTAANAYGAGSSPGGHLLVALDAVPVGGGRIIADPPVVVVRPSANKVVGFSAICTHQGCVVTSISNGTIDCPCHGSRFDLLTGRVVTSPATRPLPRVAVTVRGGQVYTS